MDGTLTCAIHDFDAIRAELGLPAGVPILEAISRLPSAEAQDVHQRLDTLEFDIATRATQQPGAVALLDHLVENNCKVGILTRNGKEIAHATLEACGLDRYFVPDDVVSRDCCTPKPNPAGVHKLMSQWQSQPDDTVMVGDYLFDLQAGFDAGSHTVHMAIDDRGDWPDITTLRVLSLPELHAVL